MTPADIPAQALHEHLVRQGVWLDVGSWRFHVRSSETAITQALHQLYADYPLQLSDPGFADFHVVVRRPAGLRRLVQPQVVFEYNDDQPFQPFPAEQAVPMLEWGMNWCVSSTTAHMLILHAAVLERGGRALVMPAPPGHGKSTLTAGLVVRGWRLLSDELAMIDLDAGALHPFTRPVSLKNRSIEVIRAFAPEHLVSAPVRDTIKGDIAYLRAPRASVQRAGEPAGPGWLVFPRYRADAVAARFEPVPKAQAFREVAAQAFNYHVLGRQGFEAAAKLIDGCDCRSFEYARLDEAVDAFAAMADLDAGD